MIKIASGLMFALYAKCASCRHSSGCEVGSPFCRVWGTVLSASWSLIELCPHWAPHEDGGSGLQRSRHQLRPQEVANRLR